MGSGSSRASGAGFQSWAFPAASGGGGYETSSGPSRIQRNSFDHWRSGACMTPLSSRSAKTYVNNPSYATSQSSRRPPEANVNIVSCATPRSWDMAESEIDDGLATLRVTLQAIHNVCKHKPRQILAVCQSLGKASSTAGPDAALAMYVHNFDHSTTALRTLLSTKRCPRIRKADLPIDTGELAKQLGTVAVDIEKWYKQFSALVFPSVMPEHHHKSAARLRDEAKRLGRHCYKLAGKMEALCWMNAGNVTTMALTSDPPQRPTSVESGAPLSTISRPESTSQGP